MYLFIFIMLILTSFVGKGDYWVLQVSVLVWIFSCIIHLIEGLLFCHEIHIA
jgi:hypothetical protein